MRNPGHVTPATYIHNTLPGQFNRMIKVEYNGEQRWANALHQSQYHLTGGKPKGEWVDADLVTEF